jgi:hypothetical protein
VGGGWVAARRLRSIAVDSVCLRGLLLHDLVAIQGCGGGGSVRMRNALHEVGGRSLGIDASAESASSQRNSHTL